MEHSGEAITEPLTVPALDFNVNPIDSRNIGGSDMAFPASAHTLSGT